MKFWLAAIVCLLLSASTSLAAPSCAAHKGMSAVDMSQPANGIKTNAGKSGFAALKALGVNTIIRYYDWANEDISCKALLPSESDAIIAAGLNIISVFQHENDDPESFFIKTRGTTDSKHALTLAKANGQPKGSAIYFAVDGVDQTIRDMVFEHGMSNGHKMSQKRRRHLIHADRNFIRHIRRYGRFLKYHTHVFHKAVETIQASDMNPAIINYFEQVNAVVKADKNYKIGAYASGAVCELLLSKKLIDYCWLAQSTGWPGFDHFFHSKRWVMVQERSTLCRNWNFANGDHVWLDFNRINSTPRGAWNKKGKVVATTKIPQVCSQ